MNVFSQKAEGRYEVVDARGELFFKVAPASIQRVGNSLMISGDSVVAYYRDEDGNWFADGWGLKHLVEGLEEQLFEKKDIDYFKIVVDEESLQAIKRVYGATCFSGNRECPTVEFVSEV